MPHKREDLGQIVVEPLAKRTSKHAFAEIRTDVDAPPPSAGDLEGKIALVADHIQNARSAGAAVILAFGAHLVRNGLADIVGELMKSGWVTHLATNGAGVIHDWEYAFQGRSGENVQANVAEGRFGTWDETGRNTHIAVLVGALTGTGYGESIGRFICEDGCEIPSLDQLWNSVENACSSKKADEHLPARAELIRVIQQFEIESGRLRVRHLHPEFSIAAKAYELGVPLTVHPGIGYDIVFTHPMANGAALGRAAGIDFSVFVHSVGQIKQEGVFLSIGSAVMAPQVLEKAGSIANNLRRQRGEEAIQPYIAVNDLATVGWDWNQSEPPIDHPAYYIRFCKSFSRMGGEMLYLGGDNRTVLHNLCCKLRK